MDHGVMDKHPICIGIAIIGIVASVEPSLPLALWSPIDPEDNVTEWGGTTQEMLIKDASALRVTLGREPGTGNSRSGTQHNIYYRRPSTRMGTIWDFDKSMGGFPGTRNPFGWLSQRAALFS